jgi:hypothetical protein
MRVLLGYRSQDAKGVFQGNFGAKGWRRRSIMRFSRLHFATHLEMRRLVACNQI